MRIHHPLMLPQWNTWTRKRHSYRAETGITAASAWARPLFRYLGDLSRQTIFSSPTLPGIPPLFLLRTSWAGPWKGWPLKPAGALQSQGTPSGCNRWPRASRVSVQGMRPLGTGLLCGPVTARTCYTCFDESFYILACFRTGKGGWGIILIFNLTIVLLVTSLLMLSFVLVLSGRWRPAKHTGSVAYGTFCVAGEVTVATQAQADVGCHSVFWFLGSSSCEKDPSSS